MIQRHTRAEPRRHERRMVRPNRYRLFAPGAAEESEVGVVKPEPTAVALAGESGSRGVMVHEFSSAPGLRDDGVRSRIAAG
ncbi:hypothetical protein CJ204_13025 [Corynebacterium xerosis]|uniref:Uncharacterized protein n=1 Tax=Corynebacterium xerosis TaxID=1725 RepID=A0A2N6SVK7_9CORY|nr:hypothetical protein CJ204_13025 [Corynebacterium xerosis]